MPDPVVTATPDTLTLNPGESAQVAVTADPDSPSGLIGVSIAVEVPPQYDYLIEGPIGPLTIAPGETGHVVGDFSLLGDLIIEGVLTGIDTFTCEGNGFQILVQHGGVTNLAGVEKTAWTGWGGHRFITDPVVPVVGWQVGDRLAVAPTKVGIYANTAATLPVELSWTGSWSTMTRPVNSPPKLLRDGRTIEPEVINLSQTLTIKNMRRGFHFHDGAGMQSLKWLRILNSGVAGVVGDYSLHFHRNDEASRGSLVEGVVVEGSKNHSFVPHASHGITMRDCAAYRVQPGAFWWDPPPQALPGTPEDAAKRSAINNSNDTTWEHCLVLHVLGGTSVTAEGFTLGAGHGNKILDSAAACTVGGKNASGFHWPGNASQNDGGNVWESRNNVSHNHRNVGVFIWQNGSSPFSGDDHLNEDWILYNIGRSGWEHGAYVNNYEQRRMIIQDVGEDAIALHAIGGISHTDALTNDSVKVHAHSIESNGWIPFTRCVFTKVIYNTNEWQEQPSHLRWIDCVKPNGLPFVPDDFVSFPTLAPISTTPGGIHPLSEIEIIEGGVLTHRWVAGAWS